MYARTITVDARPENVDAGIAYVRDEVLGAVTGMSGCIGMSMVADRRSGRCIVTSAWDSEKSMRASDGPVTPLRKRGVEVFGGSLHVDEWEMAVMHRDHPTGEGACVRATWIQGDPADVDRSIDVFKLTTLPAVAQLDGFCSASLLVNRSDGRAIATFTYDSRAALERNREQAGVVRSTTVEQMRAEVHDIREFDLVLAHLHVPEMA